MEPYRDDQFVAALESLRPEPAPEFAAELDQRAAAGFPRRRCAASGSPLRRALARVRASQPRKMLLPAGGIALTAIVVATAVVAGSSGGSESVDTMSSSAGSSESKAYLPNLDANHNASGEFSRPNAASSGASAAPEVAEEALAGAANEKFDNQSEHVETRVGDTSLVPFSKESGPYASTANHRSVERAAEMTLGTDQSEVGDAAGKVLGVVHQYDGIVLNSSVRGGSESEAGARFELLIPSAKLSDALASFSDVAEVRARHESGNDITAPTVTTGELLQDSNARIESLLNQLADAETETEQEVAEAKLRAERRHAASLKSQLTALQRRANLSRVSLRIVSDEAPEGGGAGGGWNAGDALHDAGHILSVAAGVLIVAAAVLAPIALLVLLVLLAQRAWIRSQRERALD